MKRLFGCTVALAAAVGILEGAEIRCFDYLVYQNGNYYLWMTQRFGDPVSLCTNCLAAQEYHQTVGPHEAGQECLEGNCDEITALRVAEAETPLPEPIEADHQFTDTIPDRLQTPEYAPDPEQPDVRQKDNWNPKRAAEVQSEQWIRIHNHDKTVNLLVKLYVVKLNIKKAMEDAGAQEKFRKARDLVACVGFETRGLPADEPADSVKVINLSSPLVNVIDSYTLELRPTKNSNKFFVKTTSKLTP